MFSAIYKSTFYNILRSVVFWLTLAIILIITIYGALNGYYLGDSDPTFILDYKNYVQCIINSCASDLLLYSMPIFSIVSVVLVLNNDYSNGFFEIEKAANIKPFQYFCARFLSISSINLLVLIIMHFICLHLYVFTRGGVDGMMWGDYFADSFIRVIRVDLLVAMPCVLFYIAITYFIGTLFKNGILAAIGSMGYVVMFYVLQLMFRHRIAPVYFDYLSPIPRKLRQYFHYYDTEWFEELLTMQNTSINDALLCISFLIGVVFVCSWGSYICIRKRTI